MIDERSVLCKKIISRVALARLSRHRGENELFYGAKEGRRGKYWTGFQYVGREYYTFRMLDEMKIEPPGIDEFLIASHTLPPVVMQMSMYKSGRCQGRLALLHLPNWLVVNSDIDRLHLHIFARIEAPLPPRECSAGADAMVSITRAKQERGRREEEEKARTDVTNAEVPGRIFYSWNNF